MELHDPPRAVPILRETYDAYKDVEWPPWEIADQDCRLQAYRRYLTDRYGSVDPMRNADASAP